MANDRPRRERERERETHTWPDAELCAHLAQWIHSKIRDTATVEDLTQETVLHSVLTAHRHGVSDMRQIAKIAQSIAGTLVARAQRKDVRSLETNRVPDMLTAKAVDQDLDIDREHLSALRAQLHPVIGVRQRELLDLICEEGVVRIRPPQCLSTSPANVRRMIKGLARKIAKLG